MVRFLVPLLMVVAGALVVALYRDRREREGRRLSELRGCFLHGAPLAGFAPIGSRVEVADPGLLVRIRLPAGWSGGFEDSKGASFDCGSGRRLRVELLTLEPPGAGGKGLLESLAAARPEAERSLETLPGGLQLLKYLESRGGGSDQQVVFCWQLARLLSSGQARVASFAFSVPGEQAGEVYVRADLALLDREIREAAICD